MDRVVIRFARRQAFERFAQLFPRELGQFVANRTPVSQAERHISSPRLIEVAASAVLKDARARLGNRTVVVRVTISLRSLLASGPGAIPQHIFLVMTFYEGLRARLAGGVIAAALFAAAPALTVAAAPAKVSGTTALDVAGWTAAARGTLDPQVFDLALRAASCALDSGEVGQPSTLTVIDYSKPSTAKRLWVYDLRSQSMLYNDLVAHGQGSGDNFATRFSNDAETHQSSLGLYVTQDTYVGKNGYSLR